MEKESGHSPQKKNQTEDEKRSDNQLRKLGLFGVIVADLVGFGGGGVALGYLAWAKWNAPWWVVLLTASVGLAMAFYRIYRLSQREL